MPDKPIQQVEDWWKVEKTFSDLSTNHSHEIQIRREIVPFVFVPGTMGSRLQNAKDGSPAWDPDDLMLMINDYNPVSSPAHRKAKLVGERFDPGYLKPMTGLSDAAIDEINAASGEPRMPDAAEAIARGWGSVYWKSYGKLLLDLSSPGGNWGKIWFPHIFNMPVYAVGYNWTDTNARSGDWIKANITQIIKRESQFGPCEKVIIITHSMGGLAARAASELSGGQASIQGIVHGAQPAIGAAAVYWRMKGGFEREEDYAYLLDPGYFLGRTGPQVTAVLGNMPGGLELLPHPSYTFRDGGWLRIWERKRLANVQFMSRDDSVGDNTKKLYGAVSDATQVRALLPVPIGAPQAPKLRLPQQNAVFTEIYRQRDAFYRLVDPALLDPESDLPDADAPSISQPVMPASETTAFNRFLTALEIAHKFQIQIAGKMHPHTYVFYGEGGQSTAMTVDFILERHITSETAHIPSRDIGVVASDPTLVKFGTTAEESNAWEVLFRDSTGAIYKVTLCRPNGSGDGTVPSNSGNALDPTKTNVGLSPKAAMSFAHQKAFDDNAAELFTMEAISLLLLRRACERLGVPMPV